MSSRIFGWHFMSLSCVSCSKWLCEQQRPQMFGNKVIRLQPSLRLANLHCASSPAVIDRTHEQDEIVSRIRELFQDRDGLFFHLSAYDRAWVAKLPHVSKSRLEPQFPEAIEWILNNQLADGSWGHEEVETERIRNTLACIIALRIWKRGASCVQSGLNYLNLNLSLPCHKWTQNLAIVISMLLREAQGLQLELEYDGAHIQELHSQGDIYASRLSSYMLTEYAVSFVHVLEAFQDSWTWRKLLRYQDRDGFLFSVALTACAYMQTGDELCLHYLNKAMKSCMHKSNAPCLLEQAQLLVSLEHLGIARHFEKETQQTLTCLFSYWSANGDLEMSLEDAALVFGLLHRYGYDLSPDNMRQVSINEDLLPSSTRYELCWEEDLICHGEKFPKTSSSELVKETKPWYCRMQRIDHIERIQKLGKSLRPALLTLSKNDFNLCQKIYQQDLHKVIRWNKECKFDCLGYARQKDTLCYFAPAATIFEPEFSTARIVWAKTGVLTTIVDDYFDNHDSLHDLNKLCTAVKRWDTSTVQDMPEDAKIIFQGLYNTVNSIAEDAQTLQNRDISKHLRAQWDRLVHSFLVEAEWRLSRSCPSMEEYKDNGITSFALEPIIMSTIFFMGAKVDDEMINHPDCTSMYQRVSLIGRLLNDIQGFKRESCMGECSSITIFIKENPEASLEEAVSQMRRIIDETTKELVEDLLRPSGIPKRCKRVFESMLRVLNFFYTEDDGFSSDSLGVYVNTLFNKTFN